ncbi:MAG: hypothetical protein H8D23_04135 [Candidatus Brocadiales bacterium]|nr:hypothetical protein [Candidatus Brocadiales bacterium]
MKRSKAYRIKVRVGNLWESPVLHILLTKEDELTVARCLDFTVSSHGKDEEDALKALADSIKEYVLTAVENNAIDAISDPANGKYWRMYNELESMQSIINMKRSLKKSLKSVSNENIRESTTEISYA